MGNHHGGYQSLHVRSMACCDDHIFAIFGESFMNGSHVTLAAQIQRVESTRNLPLNPGPLTALAATRQFSVCTEMDNLKMCYRFLIVMNVPVESAFSPFIHSRLRASNIDLLDIYAANHQLREMCNTVAWATFVGAILQILHAKEQHQFTVPHVRFPSGRQPHVDLAPVAAALGAGAVEALAHRLEAKPDIRQEMKEVESHGLTRRKAPKEAERRGGRKSQSKSTRGRTFDF